MLDQPSKPAQYAWDRKPKSAILKGSSGGYGCGGEVAGIEVFCHAPPVDCFEGGLMGCG